MLKEKTSSLTENDKHIFLGYVKTEFFLTNGPVVNRASVEQPGQSGPWPFLPLVSHKCTRVSWISLLSFRSVGSCGVTTF